MGFGFQTPISWQAEMWVLRNLPMGVAKRRGSIATQKGGCWPMQGIWNAQCHIKKYSVILRHLDILSYLCKQNKHYNNIWKR